MEQIILDWTILPGCDRVRGPGCQQVGEPQETEKARTCKKGHRCCWNNFFRTAEHTYLSCAAQPVQLPPSSVRLSQTPAIPQPQGPQPLPPPLPSPSAVDRASAAEAPNDAASASDAASRLRGELAADIPPAPSSSILAAGLPGCESRLTFAQ